MIQVGRTSGEVGLSGRTRRVVEHVSGGKAIVHGG